MTERVWQTTVYNKSHRRLATYHFRHLIDLEKSVNATWAENRSEITKLQMDDGREVWIYSSTSGVAVEANLIELNILENWIHF